MLDPPQDDWFLTHVIWLLYNTPLVAVGPGMLAMLSAMSFNRITFEEQNTVGKLDELRGRALAKIQNMQVLAGSI